MFYIAITNKKGGNLQSDGGIVDSISDFLRVNEALS
jgi:hypothetical protein